MQPDDERAYAQAQFTDALRQFAPAAAAELGIAPDDEDSKIVITRLCGAMFNAGVRAAASQAVAQLIDQGETNVTLNLADHLLPPDAGGS